MFWRMPLQFWASRTGRVGCRRSALFRAALAALIAGCTPRPDTAPVVSAQQKPFGGERAEFGGSPGAQPVDQNVGRCQNVPGLDADPLLADFEQDSIFLRPVPQRYGVWYMSNDGSPEGKQVPESYVGERGGYGGSNYAVHYRVEGFSEWGAVLGFLLRYTPADGIKCPFNAAAFDGLAFMARGKGRVRVNLGTPETTPSEQEGRCQKGCWDSHGAFVFLTDEWTEQRLPWSAFAQQGWGTTARLDVKELLAINFAIGRGDQPADVWLDDVRFIQRGPTATPVAPPKAHE
jgi:hypothetical protein